MLLKDFGEPFLSFEWKYFRNSFCYRIDNNRSLKYKILRGVGPLETNLTYFVSLGIAEISRCFKLSIYSEVFLLKTFFSTWNYASTLNIGEVVKFYNLGNKTFETDFILLPTLFHLKTLHNLLLGVSLILSYG